MLAFTRSADRVSLAAFVSPKASAAALLLAVMSARVLSWARVSRWYWSIWLYAEAA